IAIKAAERVRVAVEKTPFKIKRLRIPITVSAGVTTKAADAASPETLVAEADEALYKAKATGRNKVVLYKP
ncbi:MAG: diguanylate cyclase, partial [Defluviitaleaceae bacterium]|nr:diguanylate cyclase [Defluviitaleaceae bacterium]